MDSVCESLRKSRLQARFSFSAYQKCYAPKLEAFSLSSCEKGDYLWIFLAASLHSHYSCHYRKKCIVLELLCACFCCILLLCLQICVAECMFYHWSSWKRKGFTHVTPFAVCCKLPIDGVYLKGLYLKLQNPVLLPPPNSFLFTFFIRPPQRGTMRSRGTG